MKTSQSYHPWRTLAAMTTTVSMVFIDITLLPVALPTMGEELKLSPLALQWIVNAYPLTLTVMVLLGGRFADHLGLRKAFCLGTSLFAIASAFCGIGQVSYELISSRILQGLGGALMLPATQGIIAHNFPPGKRGKALGIFTSIGSLFLTLGPLIGGYFTEHLSWRYAFWINLPIAILGLCLALAFVRPLPPRPHAFDLKGSLLLIFGISSIVISIMQSQKWGWFSLPTLGGLGLGAFLLSYLIHLEKETVHPLIDLGLLKIRSIHRSLTSAVMAQTLLMISFFWAIFFQAIGGLSPTHAGILIFLTTIPICIVAPIAGHIADRKGPRWPTAFGFACLAASLFSFLYLTPTHTSRSLWPSLLLFGVGIPCIFAPNAAEVMNATPPEKRGAISGLMIATRQFGAALGLALFGTLYQPWTSINQFHLIHWIAGSIAVIGFCRMCLARGR